VRLTVWSLGGTGWFCPPKKAGESATRGTLLNGDPLGNTYRSVEYARLVFVQCTILVAVTSMGTEM
jgi:hypothetical protein